ncbi:MAG TPA: class I SAM-dependent methyltransferase [Opitutaceae bacterium]|jgi:methylase of polypeptide subunit release factors|nr:class I SAM-dependent methyltransferase [Opitutaceae bacterium]
MTPLDSVLARIGAECGASTPLPPRADLEALAAACGADAERLKRWVKRRMAGEPLAHVLGWLEFRGLRLAIDKRAYVTDPELTHLVDAVIGRGREHLAATGRGPLLAEFGAGCGSLSLAVKHGLPEARVIGLELDSDALKLARRNAKRLGLEIRLIESDLFDGWPGDLGPPDFIFGDPPWGDETTLYEPERAAGHYQSMPPASAFPLGGRTGMHRQVLEAVARRGWQTEIWLNGGTLPEAELAAAVPSGVDYKLVTSVTDVRLLSCRFSQ